MKQVATSAMVVLCVGMFSLSANADSAAQDHTADDAATSVLNAESAPIPFDGLDGRHAPVTNADDTKHHAVPIPMAAAGGVALLAAIGITRGARRRRRAADF